MGLPLAADLGRMGQQAGSRLRTLFAQAEDPYAGADVALARRFGVGLWGFGSAAVLVLELFYPPTHAFGALGWLLAGFGFLVALAIMRVLADPRRDVGFDFLFHTQFVG